MLMRGCGRNSQLLRRSVLIPSRFESLRSFSSTKPISRKNRKDVNSSPVFGIEQFNEEIKKITSTVVTAMDPVLKANDHFTIEVQPDDLVTITCRRGNYVLRPDRNKLLLHYRSYFSGFSTYYFDQEQKVWLSESDGHDLRGMITRDILRHWTSLPDFK